MPSVFALVKNVPFAVSMSSSTSSYASRVYQYCVPGNRFSIVVLNTGALHKAAGVRRGALEKSMEISVPSAAKWRVQTFSVCASSAQIMSV